jgi:Nidogen-like
VDVGYFLGHDDKLNSIQLLLVERSDTGTLNFDVEFNYDRILWETGDVSGGSNGFGGQACRVGLSNGFNRTVEWTHSGEPSAFLDSNQSTGLIYAKRNSTMPGRLIFQVRGGNILGALQVEAGSDRYPAAGTRVITLGGFANDPAGGGVTVKWTFVPVENFEDVTATFSNPNVLNPTVTFSGVGEYDLYLTATSTVDPLISAADFLRVFVN